MICINCSHLKIENVRKMKSQVTLAPVTLALVKFNILNFGHDGFQISFCWGKRIPLIH